MLVLRDKVVEDRGVRVGGGGGGRGGGGLMWGGGGGGAELSLSLLLNVNTAKLMKSKYCEVDYGKPTPPILPAPSCISLFI